MNISNFFCMPFILKIICLAGIFSPLITLGSILSGGIVSPNVVMGDYGAAANVAELVLVVVLTIPSVIVSILLLQRKKSGSLLFLPSYVLATCSPMAMSLFWHDAYHMLSALVPALVIGGVAWGYLLFSKDIDVYLNS